MEKLASTTAHQAATTEAINALRREMEVGYAGIMRRQDTTNGRVTQLEADRGRMQVDIAAMEAFTPGLFKSLEELAAKKSQDHERIWQAIEKLTASDQADHERVARDQGWRGGATKIGALAWAALISLLAAGAWIADKVLEFMSRTATQKP